MASAYCEVRAESLDENWRETAGDGGDRVEQGEQHRPQMRIEGTEASLQREHWQRGG